jgi:uncharacterized protein (TIRG00374 family)
MKRILLPLLQTAITLFLLWWIFRDPTKRASMAEAIKTADFIWLIPGIVAVGMAFLLQTERWRQLLKVQGIHLTWLRTWRITMIGGFFNLFLLGATGGDVVKIFYAIKEAGSKKTAALLSVLVDRMIGLIALVAVTVFVCSLRWSELMSHPFTQAMMGTLFFVMGGMVGMIVAGFVVDRFHLSRFIPSWLPMHGKIMELSQAFSIYARDLKVLLVTIGLSIPAHFCNFLAYYFAARAFGSFAGKGGVMDIFSVMPMINTIAALPISLSGVGVREQLFEKSFAALFGTPASLAVMISMTGFMITVFWGLIGGLIYLLHRPTGGVKISEMEDAVDSLEKSIENQA